MYQVLPKHNHANSTRRINAPTIHTDTVHTHARSNLLGGTRILPPPFLSLFPPVSSFQYVYELQII